MRKNIDAQPPHRSYEYTIAAVWPRISALGENMQGASLDLPTRYYLERDPDIMILRRPDGAMVGAFSARGAVSKSVRLQARFFGHFEVLYGDEVITLGRSGKALTILKYLLAHRSRPVSQDHLMGWLWPESNLKKARWSLNAAIHVLRKLLSDCPSSAPLNYVLLEEGYYRLCPGVQVITDVDEFDERYERGRRLEKEGRTEEAAAEYEKAIELYRGEYLVEDLYEDWTMVERERLSNAYVDMLSRLAVHYYETEQYQESIRVCYRILEKDRCHEESYRLLMRCYVSLGLRGRAMRHYRLCEEILLQEYSMVPSPETEAIYRNLLFEHH